MAIGKLMGPGGRIARAEKKVDKAKDKVSKLVGKYGIASTDGPDVYFKKKEMQAKIAPKIAKAVSKVDKAKGKLTTATRKVAEKAEAKYDKGRASKKGETAMDMINRRIDEMQVQVKSPMSGSFKQAIKQRKYK